MGARSIESRLRARVLSVVAPAVVGVAVVSVSAAAWSLHRADDESAHGRAVSALLALRAEDAEGDDPITAGNEVMSEGTTDHVRLAIRDRGGASFRAMSPILAFPQYDDGCTSFVDGATRWRACAAADDRRSVVAAIDVTARNPLLFRLSAIVAVAASLVLLGTWLAVRRAVRETTSSLRTLVDWSARVVEDTSTPPPPSSGTTEIDRLSVAFDAVVRRLLDALARERATAAHIAHELRTPLTAIAGELDALGATDEARTSAIERARRDVHELARVIDAILYLSRPATPDALRPAVVNVADVVRELRAEPTTVRAPDEALVESDAALVELAVRNLLDNARKHAGRDAHEIVVEREGDRVRVTVVDDGPGVDEATRARMFERYFRGVSSSSGSGLGLALVRAVARRHGGDAAVASGPNGRGLAVSITLGPLLGWYDKDARSPPSSRPSA